MTENVFLRRLSRWQAEQQREALADLWVEAYRGVVGHRFRDRQDFLRRFADELSLTGFDMVIAGAAGGSAADTVGCAYGFRADRSDESWQHLNAGALPEAEELTASGQVFAVAELMVLPAHRREGIATRMLDLLLTRADSALALARVEGDGGRAGAAFRSWGWTPVARPPLGRYEHPRRGSRATEFWTRRLDR